MKSSCIAFVPTVALISLFAGCDFLGGRALDRERADSIYKEAMDEYTAGHVDKAIEGLERVVRATPGNSSARFQLACLLQDVKKDYLGAICNYREFLAQDRSGDKETLARSRISQCERMLGPELVRKYDAGAAATQIEQTEKMVAKVAGLEMINKDLESRLEKAMARVEESAKETERMRRMLTGEVAEDATRPVIKTETALLDEEDDGKSDRIRFSEDAKNLVIEEDKEDLVAPFQVTGKKTAPETKQQTSPEPPHEPRPAEYVVQEGDTLYRLAVRFYGRRSAWTQIREANKTVVTTDGRIRVGQKLVLP